MTGKPFIPEMITVHLGAPDSIAENVTLPFVDYIKNVASSEIFSTWPLESLKANIYAQISFALNRVYTEWYRAKGYDFDITSSTQYDQKFVNNRNIYEEIDTLVDEIFNSYLRQAGTVNPYFAEYCNGTTAICAGLSQWGTVDLAEEGKDALEIVRYYYGDNMELVENARTSENIPSYRGVPIQRGDFGPDVSKMQIALNRISTNYSTIPKIPQIDGAFGQATEDAVRAFQKIFKLAEDGVVGKATWYKIISIYNAVKRLAELTTEGITLAEVPKQYRRSLRRGDSGSDVEIVQYFLSFLADFDDEIPMVKIDGFFGPETENAVKAFQQSRGLTADGIVGNRTWQASYSAYKGIVDTIGEQAAQATAAPYPGVVLRRGMSGPSIRLVQEELDYLSRLIYEIPALATDGIYGIRTQEAVRAFQELFNLPVTGEIDRATWEKLAGLYVIVKLGDRRLQEQYPGYTIGQR